MTLSTQFLLHSQLTASTDTDVAIPNSVLGYTLAILCTLVWELGLGYIMENPSVFLIWQANLG